jgi:SNF2 family DNA or RNA helicase
VWSEAEESAKSIRERLDKRKQPRPRKAFTGAGVGKRNRGRQVPARERAINRLSVPSFFPADLADDLEVHSTVSSHRRDVRPYNPPEPIVFQELEADGLDERPVFDSNPCAPKQDLLLASGGVIPGPIAQWLRPYQVEGVEFMFRRWKDGQGGILGDDMGLGSMFISLLHLTCKKRSR